MHRLFLFVLLLCASSLAQTVRLGHYGTGGTFRGWLRTTINQTVADADADTALPECGAFDDGTTFVLGRRIGTDVRVCDLHVKLASGELRSIDLRAAKPADYDLGPIPTDTGWPTVAGVPLVPAAGSWLQRDGAAWLVHLHGRTGPMLHVDLWAWVYPGQPWARGEIVLCASNPTVPDMATVIPERFTLTCGDTATVLVPGLADGAPLLRAGEVLGDGQAKAFPFTIVWPQKLKTALDATSAGATARFEIGAVGLSRLHAVLGNPELPERFNPATWVAQHWRGAVERLHSWDAGPLGVTATSRNTGDQEDQGWCKGAEAMHPRGAGAELVRYFVALGELRRPCHHLEPWGQLLDLRRHDRLVFWDARAHIAGVSPDQLGKARQPTTAETHGWWGPDDEHFLLNTRAAAARLTGSPALQWDLEAQARVYLLTDTVKPSLTTSTARAPRARGWAGIAVTHLWTTLEDRALAEQVAARWRQRVAIYRSAVMQPGDVWGTTDDIRVLSEVKGGATAARVVYQEAVGAFGVWLGSEACGPWDGRSLAVACARGLVQAGYSQDAGRWVEWDFVRWPQPNYVEGDGAHRTGWFAAAWWPMGVWTAAQAGDERARSIWAQIHGEASAGASLPLTWFPPAAWAQ